MDGVIGTSDVWNDEIDRIARFHTQYGTAVEEMETASAARWRVCSTSHSLEIRVVSDNVTNGTPYDARTGEVCEDYVYEVVRAYDRSLKK